jgi:hypothetical protein
MALWELPELGEDMGVFWWWNHHNTPIFPLYHADSQKPNQFLDNSRISYIIGKYTIKDIKSPL